MKVRETETVVEIDDEPAAGAAGVVVDDEGGAAAIVDEDEDGVVKLPARATRNADGSITLRMRDPKTIQVRSATKGVRSEEYKSLTFHRLAGADLRAITSASAEAQPAVMLARSARIREPIMAALFDLMDGADIADAATCVDSFFGSGRKTGR